MNPALTTNLLSAGKSIENNALAPIDDAENSLSDDLFSGEFSSAMEDVLAEDGKLKPLDFAALTELGIQGLTKLESNSGIDLPTETLELKQQPNLNILALETEEKLESIDIFGNPATASLLESTKLQGETLDEGTLNKSLNKMGIINTKVSSDTVVAQPVMEQEADLSKSFDDFNLSKYMKELGKNDVDVKNEFLTTVTKQDTNAAKLADHLGNIDKPLNAINSNISHPLKSYTNLNTSGAVLSRIEVPVSQSGWGEAVGNRLMMMANGKVQSANIQITPAELGPIEIRVNVNQDQVNVHFISNNALVREAIEDAFPRLKEMFVQNGLSLNDANVSQQSAQQGNTSSSKENESEMSFNDDLIEDTTDSSTESTTSNLVDIGLVDQYV